MGTGSSYMSDATSGYTMLMLLLLDPLCMFWKYYIQAVKGCFEENVYFAGMLMNKGFL